MTAIRLACFKHSNGNFNSGKCHQFVSVSFSLRHFDSNWLFYRNFYSKDDPSANANGEISDNRITNDEPKDVFQDLQIVIQDLDTKMKKEKLMATASEDETEPPIPTLGDLIGIQPM